MHRAPTAPEIDDTPGSAVDDDITIDRSVGDPLVDRSNGDPLVDDELVIEEISIDGMCGVY